MLSAPASSLFSLLHMSDFLKNLLGGSRSDGLAHLLVSAHSEGPGKGE